MLINCANLARSLQIRSFNTQTSLVGRNAEAAPIDKGAGPNGPKGAGLEAPPVSLEI